MPAKYEGRTIDLEQALAGEIQRLRKAADLSYQQLADKMKAVGCEIFPSGIQKTEKAGRRITVDELLGYARVFDVSAASLIGDERGEALSELWRNYLALERLQNIMRTVNDEYGEALGEVVESAEKSPELLVSIRGRHTKYLAIETAKARRQAARDNVDVSTPDALHDYMTYLGVFRIPVVAAAQAVMERINDGESN